MKKSVLITLILLFQGLTLYSQWPEYTCEFPAGEKGASALASVPYLGTFKAVAIWATGPNPTPEFVPEGELMPTWWKNIFNNSYSEIANIPNYISMVSLNQMHAQIEAFCQDEDNLVPYTASIDPPHTDSGVLDWYTSGMASFIEQILTLADEDIDFSEFDATGPNNQPDNVVDYLFFIITGYSGNNGTVLYMNNGGQNGYYVTNDRSATGSNITVKAMNGMNQSISPREQPIFRDFGMGVLLHELGHRIGDVSKNKSGFPDLDHGGGENHYCVGDFCLMNNWNGFSQRPSPVNPMLRTDDYSKSWGVEWSEPVKINDFGKLENQLIQDYNSSGDAYKLVSPSSTGAFSDQYFIVTRHNKEIINYWQSLWPIPNMDALLIWHINPNGNNKYREQKWIDLERAQGMTTWDLTNPADPIDTKVPNSITGFDSLDFHLEENQGGKDRGSWCYFYNQNFNSFNDGSNPNSSLIRSQSPYSQDIPSRLAVNNIRKTSGNYYADFYSNAWAGTISSNTTWDKDVYVYGDLTVNSGVVLTINADVIVKEGVTFYVSPGAQLKFASGKKLTINGTLIAQGASSNHVTFTSSDATPSAGDWYGIRFEDSSNDANCILEYCDIQYAQYGVYCNRANPKIENNTITNNNYGIYSYYSSSDIKTNSITNNSTGIYGTNSSPYLYDNNISNNGTSGVEFWTLSQPVFCNNSFKDNGLIGTAFKYYCYPKFGPTSGSNKGFNVVADNDVYGVYNYYYTDPFMGSTDAYNQRIGGYNSIANNSGYNLYAYDNCVAYAHWNWWGAGVPPVNKFYNYLSWIYYTPYLTTDPGGGSTLGKIVTVQSTLSDKNRDYEAAGFDPKKPNPNRLSDLWLWGQDLSINNRLDDAIQIYKILIKKFSATEQAKHSLVKIYHLSHERDRNDLNSYLIEIINNPEISKNLKPVVYELLAGDYLYNKDLVNAGKIYDEIRQKYPDSEHEKLALFCQVLATRIDLNDVESAKGYVEIMKQKYQDDELTFRASEEMGEKVDWSLAKRTRQPEAIKQILPEKFALRNNYPNPFNPTTTIAFDLPEESHITLTIYDLSSREIVRLANENVPAGFHQVVWDGKDKTGQTVASGLYLYSLRTSAGFNATNKMVFVR